MGIFLQANLRYSINPTQDWVIQFTSSQTAQLSQVLRLLDLLVSSRLSVLPAAWPFLFPFFWLFSVETLLVFSAAPPTGYTHLSSAEWSKLWKAQACERVRVSVGMMCVLKGKKKWQENESEPQRKLLLDFCIYSRPVSGYNLKELSLISQGVKEYALNSGASGFKSWLY